MKRHFIFSLLLLTFISIIAYSQGGGLNVYQINNFKGGLNTRIDPILLDDSQTPESRNILFDEGSGLFSHTDIDVVASLPVAQDNKIISSYVYKKDDGSIFYIVQVGSTVYYTQELNNNSIWTVIKTGLSTAYPVKYATHFNKCWMTNGTNDVFSFDGSNTTDYSFIPHGKYILSSDNRLWVASTPDMPSSVWFSRISVDPSTTDTWPADNQLNIGLGDGQVITSIKEVGNIITVFKENSIYGIIGSGNSDLTDYSVVKYSTNYGALSDNSISDYIDGKIFLDKKGLYLWNGSALKEISNPIKPMIDSIGLNSISSGKWHLTDGKEFDEGTYDNCFGNFGYIATSTMTKQWSSNSDYQPAYTGSTQYLIDNNSVKISTTSGSNLTKISLVYNESAGNWNNFNGTEKYGTSNGDRGYWTDNDENTWSALVFWNRNVFHWVNFREVNSLPMHLKKIVLKYRFVIYDIPFNQLIRTYYVKYPKGEWGSSGVYLFSQFQLDTYKANFDNATRTIYQLTARGNHYTEEHDDIIVHTIDIDDTTYNAPEKGYPERIQIGLNPNFEKISVDGVPNRGYMALQLYDVSAYKMDTTTFYYSSATYISPIFDSGYINTQYQYLKPVHSLGTSPLSGSISYYTRSSSNPDMSGATGWYSLGVSSAVDTALNSKRYFQFKAELATSSNTFTPTLHSVMLQYTPVQISTYTSKVAFTSKDIKQYGVFAVTEEGENDYYIRSATWSFASNNTSINWTKITPNSDLSVPATHYYIQWRAVLKNSQSKIHSVTISWYAGSGTGSGINSQDVASAHFDNRYFIATSSFQSHNDVIYILDKNGAWTLLDIPVVSFMVNKGDFYACSSTAPVILKIYPKTDNGIKLHGKWVSKLLTLGTPDIDKTITKIGITAKGSGTLTVGYRSNYDITFSTFTITLNSTTDNYVVNLPIMSPAKYWQIYVDNPDRFELQAINIYYTTEILKAR